MLAVMVGQSDLCELRVLCVCNSTVRRCHVTQPSRSVVVIRRSNAAQTCAFDARQPSIFGQHTARWQQEVDAAFVPELPDRNR